MSSLSCMLLLALALSFYAAQSQTKSLRNEHQDSSASNAANSIVQSRNSGQHFGSNDNGQFHNFNLDLQNSHGSLLPADAPLLPLASAAARHNDIRLKRSQHDFGPNPLSTLIAQYEGNANNAGAVDSSNAKNNLNEIIDELEDSQFMQAATAAAAAAASAASTAAAAAAASPSQDFDLENIPPITYYLLLQRFKQLQAAEPSYRVRTPRLGRSIDFQQLLADDGNGSDGGFTASAKGLAAAGGLFSSRVIKKSVPFKPRLGKRGQICD